MCQIWVDDYCEVWIETPRKARKEHKCNTCGRTILNGQSYIAHFNVFEGMPTTEKICQECDKDRGEFCTAHGCKLSPSSFLEHLTNCISEDDEGKEWKPMLDRIRERKS